MAEIFDARTFDRGLHQGMYRRLPLLRALSISMTRIGPSSIYSALGSGSAFEDPTVLQMLSPNEEIHRKSVSWRKSTSAARNMNMNAASAAVYMTLSKLDIAIGPVVFQTATAQFSPRKAPNYLNLVLTVYAPSLAA